VAESTDIRKEISLESKTNGVTAYVILWSCGGILLAGLSGDIIAALFAVGAMVAFPIFANQVEEEGDDEEEFDDEEEEEFCD
jgi:hypothetical protein